MARVILALQDMKADDLKKAADKLNVPWRKLPSKSKEKIATALYSHFEGEFSRVESAMADTSMDMMLPEFVGEAVKKAQA
jgi:hypothetical protein